jgi:hypothetical protein
MGNHSPIPNESQLTLTQELIQRYKKRARECWREPSPYIKPLWEISEIEQKIKQLQKLK